MTVLDTLLSPSRRTSVVAVAVLSIFSFLTLALWYNPASYYVQQVKTAVKLDSGPPGTKHGPYVQYRPGPHWHGWQNVQHMIVFGDSWSITGFVPEKEQPSIENPLGNPHGLVKSRQMVRTGLIT
ncbi:hypothetical protein MRB53_038816 [Persea americana]|nr:hypothetical protein MRB53_038816 [Persea americana]